MLESEGRDEWGLVNGGVGKREKVKTVGVKRRGRCSWGKEKERIR